MDVIQAMNSITDQHREQVMAFIENLINNFNLISYASLIASKVINEKIK